MCLSTTRYELDGLVMTHVPRCAHLLEPETEHGGEETKESRPGSDGSCQQFIKQLIWICAVKTSGCLVYLVRRPVQHFRIRWHRHSWHWSRGSCWTRARLQSCTGQWSRNERTSCFRRCCWNWWPHYPSGSRAQLSLGFLFVCKWIVVLEKQRRWKQQPLKCFVYLRNRIVLCARCCTGPNDSRPCWLLGPDSSRTGHCHGLHTSSTAILFNRVENCTWIHQMTKQHKIDLPMPFTGRTVRCWSTPVNDVNKRTKHRKKETQLTDRKSAYACRLTIVCKFSSPEADETNKAIKHKMTTR